MRNNEAAAKIHVDPARAVVARATHWGKRPQKVSKSTAPECEPLETGAILSPPTINTDVPVDTSEPGIVQKPLTDVSCG